MFRSTASRSTVATGVSREATSTSVAKPDDGVALDVEADEVRLDRRARRQRGGEETPVLRVHLLEHGHVAEVHPAPPRVAQRAARRARHRIEVLEHLPNLGGD